MIAICSTYYANWTGDGQDIKVYNKTMQGCYITVGGIFTTERSVDWIAFGTANHRVGFFGPHQFIQTDKIIQ